MAKQKQTILFAEERDGNRVSLEDALSEEGYNVIAVADRKTLERALKHEHFDGIVLGDLGNDSHRDYVDLVTHVGKSGKLAAVVTEQGLETGTAVRDAVVSLGAAYLPKPTDLEPICRAVREKIRSR